MKKRKERECDELEMKEKMELISMNEKHSSVIIRQKDREYGKEYE